MKKNLVLVILVAACGTCWSQSDTGGEKSRNEMRSRGEMPKMQHHGMLKEVFFPPELIMGNQEFLGLEEEQKAVLKDAMKESISQSMDLQWQENAEEESMASMLKQDKIDEAKTLEQLDKLLLIENQIKKLHMGTMIKILNVLSPEQRTKLKELKKNMGMRAGEDERHRQGAVRGKKDSENPGAGTCPAGK